MQPNVSAARKLFTFSILAASLVCSSPALAERAANPADLEAYKVASYQAPVRGKRNEALPEPCSTRLR
jgi:hypothetical protein